MINIISADEVPLYVEKGYNSFDGHLHCRSGDTFRASCMDPLVLYKQMIYQGFFPILFTDHDNLEAYCELEHKTGKPVNEISGLIRGVELTFRPIKIDFGYGRVYENPHTLHINSYDFTPKEFEDMTAISTQYTVVDPLTKKEGKRGDLRELLDYVNRSCKEIPHVLNHPGWAPPGERPDWSFLPDIASLFPVIEVFNHSRTSRNNSVAYRLAKGLNKGSVAGSDSHVGYPVKATLAQGENFREMWYNIVNGNSIVVSGCTNYERACFEIMERFRQRNSIDRACAQEHHFSLDTENSIFDSFINIWANPPYRNGDGPNLKSIISNVFNWGFPKVTNYIARLYIDPQNKTADEIEEILFKARSL